MAMLPMFSTVSEEGLHASGILYERISTVPVRDLRLVRRARSHPFPNWPTVRQAFRIVGLQPDAGRWDINVHAA